MDKRILAVLIAAMAGSAYAQSSYVTQGNSRPVLNSSGGYWTTPSSNAPAASVAPARQQVAQGGPRSDRARGVAGNASSAGTPAPSSMAPRSDAYLTDAGTQGVVVNSAGHCVRTGSWSPDKAAAPCDAVARASAPAPVVAAAPEEPPAPQAAPEPAPAPRVIEKVTLNTDVLFPFNKAELLPGGRDKLDELAKDAQGADVDRIVLAGYADRIGSEQYNKDLSERRAQAVADYLASKGVDQSKLQVEGHGKDNPVTGDQCDHMGRASAKNSKLIACLQPDRRVEAELLGSRETAGTAAAPAGATSSGTSGSSSGTGDSSSGSSTR